MSVWITRFFDFPDEAYFSVYRAKSKTVRVLIYDSIAIIYKNSMQSLATIFDNSNKQIKRFISNRTKNNHQWWTPIWRGLIADPNSKHRKAMGSAVWIFLYLLTYTNRSTGIVRRKISQIREDTGYPLRTIQRHLKRLTEKNYITVTRAKQYLHINIRKWKSFKHSDSDEK